MQATLSSSTFPSRWKSAAWPLAILLALALFPPVAAALGLDFYIGFVRRVLVVALAAASLNFIMGFGGMVALGHAGFMGVGAYAVVLLSDAGFTSAWVMWPAAALLLPPPRPPRLPLRLPPRRPPWLPPRLAARLASASTSSTITS